MSHLVLFLKTLWCGLKSQCWRRGVFPIQRINPLPSCGGAGAASSPSRAFAQPCCASSAGRRVPTTVTPCTAASPSPLSYMHWKDHLKHTGFPPRALAPFTCTETGCGCTLRLLSAGLSHFLLLGLLFWCCFFLNCLLQSGSENERHTRMNYFWLVCTVEMLVEFCVGE